MLLIKNADLYTPIHLGIVDILIDDGKIVKIQKNIKDVCAIYDCKGKVVCPAFVDGHEHLNDTNYYTPEGIIKSGVSCVVGVLANESDPENVQSLIDQTILLKKRYGINAYCLAGSKNYTNDLENFILNNKCVVGIKTALFTEYRPKPNLSYEKLKQDTLTTYNAGLKSKKKVQVHIHLDHPFGRGQKANVDDINSGKLDNLDWIDRIVKETGVPYSLFKLTHAQKYYKRILEYANKGVYIDYTAFDGNYDKRFDDLVNAIKTKSVDASKISISSDLGILSMEKGQTEKESPITLLNTIKKLVLEKGVDLETALQMITTNALDPIIHKKQLIKIGCKYPMLVMDKNFNIIKMIDRS